MFSEMSGSKIMDSYLDTRDENCPKEAFWICKSSLTKSSVKPEMFCAQENSPQGWQKKAKPPRSVSWTGWSPCSIGMMNTKLAHCVWKHNGWAIQQSIQLQFTDIPDVTYSMEHGDKCYCQAGKKPMKMLASHMCVPEFNFWFLIAASCPYRRW